MPNQTRTYRTLSAEDILKNTKRIPVVNHAAYVVNGSVPSWSSQSHRALCQVDIHRGKIIESRWVCDNGDSWDTLGNEDYALIDSNDDNNEF